MAGEWNVGEFDQLVDLEEKDTRVSETGTPKEQWVAFASGIWCSVTPLQGYEMWRAQQIRANLTHRVRMWYLPGVKATMRVKLGDRYLYLLSPPIDPGERHETLELLCSEG